MLCRGHRIGTPFFLAIAFAVVMVALASTACPLRAEDSIIQAVNATYKITNASSTATAFVISRQTEGEEEVILVTAAHVLEKMKGEELRFVYRRRTDDGGYARREFPIKVRDKAKVLWRRHDKADVAAMRIDLPADHSVTPLPLSYILAADEQLHLGEDVWVLGYPAKLESSRGGFPVLRHGTVASFPLIPSAKTRTFMVDYTTFGGDSGGPVFRRETKKDSPPTIVGLIHGQHRETTKATTHIEERTVHRQMGLAIVVHGKFIRETIDLVK